MMYSPETKYRSPGRDVRDCTTWAGPAGMTWSASAALAPASMAAAAAVASATVPAAKTTRIFTSLIK